MAHPGGRPYEYDPNKPEIFAEKVDSYFVEENKPWTISGLCLHLDIWKETFYEYAKKPEFVDSTKKARLKIENFTEQKLHTQNNVVGIIFSLKNNFKWVDRHEVTTINETERLTKDDIQKYLEDKK